MQNVIMKGDLRTTIDLDTIRKKSHLFGLGPAENLQGEILIVDGTAYHSFIGTDGKMKVDKGFGLKAPFFVYANVERWLRHNLPDTVTDLKKLDFYLTNAFASRAPFVFKLTGKINHADIHIVNLPSNSKIGSPIDAHIGQVNAPLAGVESILIGFFSTHHKGVFTHHDSHVHIHLITADAAAMGHLDAMKIDPTKIALYISVN